MGLKSVLQDIIPMADICVYPSVKELREDAEVPCFHYFVAAQQLLSDMDFFLPLSRQLIVLTAQPMLTSQLSQFYTLDTSLPERELLKAVLRLRHHGHGAEAHPSAQAAELPISKREAEVLALVVRGRINKEIADELCISLPTVISHRKNICEKLSLRSVSALTIYAVTHGIVSIEEI